MLFSLPKLLDNFRDKTDHKKYWITDNWPNCMDLLLTLYQPNTNVQRTILFLFNQVMILVRNLCNVDVHFHSQIFLCLSLLFYFLHGFTTFFSTITTFFSLLPPVQEWEVRVRQAT